MICVPPDNQSVTIVILAGGQGRRLQGQDKGLVVLNGKPLIEHVLSQVTQWQTRILISANRNIEQYQYYGYPIIKDNVSGFAGPLAGFLSALQTMQTDWCLTIPVDAPITPCEYFNRMSQHPSALLRVAHDGNRVQPVYSLIHASMARKLQEALNAKKYAVHRWLEQNHALQIDFSDCPETFQNVNTLEELTDYRSGTP